jgi:hypothetical protein
VLAYTARLAMVAIGGWWLASIDAPARALFALIGGGMIVLGLGTALSIRMTRWANDPQGSHPRSIGAEKEQQQIWRCTNMIYCYANTLLLGENLYGLQVRHCCRGFGGVVCRGAGKSPGWWRT